jgi:hypothetical protein
VIALVDGEDLELFGEPSRCREQILVRTQKTVQQQQRLASAQSGEV